MATTRQTSHPKLLERSDIELILLQNQLDFSQRWLIFPDCLAPSAQEFLSDLVSWLQDLRIRKVEVANA